MNSVDSDHFESIRVRLAITPSDFRSFGEHGIAGDARVVGVANRRAYVKFAFFSKFDFFVVHVH